MLSSAAIVLAAGQGTRMRSRVPKVLHPLAGRPMLHHVLDALAAAGFGGLVCVELGHLGADEVNERRMIADAVRWLRERGAG